MPVFTPFAVRDLPHAIVVSGQEGQLKALHLVDEKARPKLRILCLHGYLQNSEV